MMVDTLVQIQAVHRANKEEEERNNREIGDRLNRRKILSLGSQPFLVKEKDSYKLRSTKWFDQDEISIVCSVFESGFIVQRRAPMDDLITFGIALWDLGYEKTKDSKYLNIYTVIDGSVVILNIKKFWKVRTQIRICNNSDKYHTANDEVTIRSQLKRSEKMSFSSEESFVYFCRYKSVEAVKQGTDSVWNFSSILARIRSFSLRGN